MMKEFGGVIWTLRNAQNLPPGHRETWEGQGIISQLALPLLTGGDRRRKEMNEQ